MKIFLTGANGQLGREINKQFQENYQLILLDRQTLDITDFKSVETMVKDIKPDIVINAAAFTKVEEAEDHPEKAYQVNTIGAQNLAIVCKRNLAKLVHLSTDYVFDGTKAEPYDEFDPSYPLSVYGKSKLWGEKLVEQAGGNHFILRTSWLYGEGNNFVRTMLGLADQRDTISVVADQYGTPTYTKDLVWVIERLMQTDFYGIYHASNKGSTTWFEFAKTIFALSGKSIVVKPLVTDNYPLKAVRPKYAVLDNKLLKLRGLDIMRPWEEALKDYIDSTSAHTK